jgi:hypothetical protein
MHLLAPRTNIFIRNISSTLKHEINGQQFQKVASIYYGEVITSYLLLT